MGLPAGRGVPVAEAVEDVGVDVQVREFGAQLSDRPIDLIRICNRLRFNNQDKIPKHAGQVRDSHPR